MAHSAASFAGCACAAVPRREPVYTDYDISGEEKMNMTRG